LTRELTAFLNPYWVTKVIAICLYNATLASELIAPITQVEIRNPYNEKEHLDDKLSIVDVKAKDEHSRIYQIEIQLLFFSNLPRKNALYVGGCVQSTATKWR
jgi:hypothetical protein